MAKGYETHRLSRLLKAAADQPWSSVEDLAARTNRPSQVVRRQCENLTERGLFSVRKAGMVRRPQNRFLLTPYGAAEAFDLTHEHHTVAELDRLYQALVSGDEPEYVVEFDRRYQEVHTHSPWRDDRLDDHIHLPWTAGTDGPRVVYTRLPLAELVYPHLPHLLTSGIVRVAEPSVGQRRNRRLSQVRWIRMGRLYHLVATYGDDIWVAFTYVGTHITASALREKVAFRFSDLDRYDERVNHPWPPVMFDPAGEDVEPTPSLHVVAGVDRFAEELAVDVLRHDLSGDICSITDLLQNGALAHPRKSLLADPLTNTRLPAASKGDRQQDNLMGWLHRRPGTGAIGQIGGHSVLVTAAQFPGMLLWQLAAVAGISHSTARAVLGKFIDGGAIMVEGGEHYVTRSGISLLARLSRTTVAQAMGPTARFLERKGRDKERAHNGSVNLFAALCAKAGSRPLAGWRGEVNIVGVTQVKPDLLVKLREGPGGAGWYMVEVERTAKYPSKVLPKLRPYRRLDQAGHDVRLLVVTLEDRARRNFSQLGNGLPMAVAVLAALKEGMPAGKPGLWLGGGGATTSVQF